MPAKAKGRQPIVKDLDEKLNELERMSSPCLRQRKPISGATAENCAANTEDCGHMTLMQMMTK